MKTTHFNAFCPVEIGDQLRDTSGRIHTITDIACVHYVRTGKVEFRFELDGSGQYAPIEVQDAPPEMRVRIRQNDPQAEEAKKIAEAVTHYPVTVEEVEMLGRFCRESALHGPGLASFLWEALTAKQKGRF